MTLSNHQPVQIKAKRFISFASRTKFMGFYIPASPDTYAICDYLAEGYKESLKHMDDTFKVNGQVLGEVGRTSSDDLIFSGRIYIYHEDYLSPEQIGMLVGAYKTKNLDVKLRSQEYLVNRQLAQDRNEQSNETISQRSVEISDQIKQVTPVVEALKNNAPALAESDKTSSLLGRVIVQFDQLESGIAAQEQISGARHTEERLAAAEHAIKELRAILGNVVTKRGPQGQILIIKTAPNVFRVTFAVPMRVAPTLKFFDIPAGASPNVHEITSMGFTVEFLPNAIPVESFNFSASAEL